MPKIRLVCVDVDGTLMGASGDVHPAVWPAVARARTAGIHLAMCSGRPGFGVTRQLAEQLAPDGWHSFQTGASILHLATRRSLSTLLPSDTVEQLKARARVTGRVLELYTDVAYAVEVSTDRARAHAGLLGVPFQPRPFESLGSEIVRGQWVLSEEEADAVAAEPHPGLHLTRSTSPLMPDSRFLNLTASGVDKGSSVRVIAEQYGVGLDEVMFVGDGWNDVPALELVGFPVAMGNADPEARAIARTCVGTADEGGVAQALALALGP
ncbi:MAG: HAD hydrolase family protein [Myxococcaceae bacterium]